MVPVRNHSQGAPDSDSSVRCHRLGCNQRIAFRAIQLQYDRLLLECTITSYFSRLQEMEERSTQSSDCPRLTR
jgi:hypothetical protein